VSPFDTIQTVSSPSNLRSSSLAKGHANCVETYGLAITGELR
jgi:hypothetical protein